MVKKSLQRDEILSREICNTENIAVHVRFSPQGLVKLSKPKWYRWFLMSFFFAQTRSLGWVLTWPANKGDGQQHETRMASAASGRRGGNVRQRFSYAGVTNSTNQHPGPSQECAGYQWWVESARTATPSPSGCQARQQRLRHGRLATSCARKDCVRV